MLLLCFRLFWLLLQPTPRTQQSHKNLNIQQRKHSKFSLLHDSTTTHYTTLWKKKSAFLKVIPETHYLFYISYLSTYYEEQKRKHIKNVLSAIPSSHNMRNIFSMHPMAIWV